MTDPDERAINRAIAYVPNRFQDVREEARAALHRIFRNTRKLEAEVERLRDALQRVEANTYDDGLRELARAALADQPTEEKT